MADERVQCPADGCAHSVPSKHLKNLRVHLINVHSWQKERVTDFDNARRKAAVETSGGKAHVCAECGKSYATSTHLKRHVGNSHPVQGEQVNQAASDGTSKDSDNVPENPDAAIGETMGDADIPAAVDEEVVELREEDEEGEEGEKEDDEPGKGAQGGFECPVDSCSERLKSRMALAEHCGTNHCDAAEQGKYTTHEVRLESAEDYEEWKEKLEEKAVTNFNLESVKIRKEYKIQYFWCSRANRKSKKGKDLRAEWRHTVTRHCSAFLTVKIFPNGEHEVTYCIGHCGHPVEPGSLRIPKRIQSLIDYHFANDQTNDWILRRIRSEAKEDSRARFLLLKDIINLETRRGGQKWKHHKEDIESVRLFEAKTKGTHVRIQDNPLKIFLVTDEQIAWAKQYGNRVLCLDDTFSVTKYDLRLLIVAVMDDVDRTLPIAFLFSSTMTERDVRWCLKNLRDLMGEEMIPRYFMSDDTNVFWNALIEVFPTCETKTTKLLCLFHVIQAVKRQVPKKVEDLEVRKRIVATFREMCTESSIPRFLRALLNLLEWLNANGHIDFLDYLRKYYLGHSRLREWAPCYRRASPIGVNCGLERMNSRLKHHHLKSSGNSRLDNTMFQCVEMVRDIKERYTIADARNLVGGRHRLQETHTRHQDALNQFTARSIETISPDKFAVLSSKKKRKYVVQRYRDCPCKSSVTNHCTRCLACPYAWACQCQDSRKAGVLCKHVHAIMIYGEAIREDEEAIDRHHPPATIPVPATVEDAPLLAAFDVDDLQEGPADHEMEMLMDEGGDERARQAVALDDEKKLQISRLESMLNQFRVTLRSYQNSDMEGAGRFLEETETLLTSHRSGGNSLGLDRRAPVAPGRPLNAVPIRAPSGLKKRAEVKRERYLAAAPIELVHFDATANETKLCALCHSNTPPVKTRGKAVEMEGAEDEWHYCEKVCRLWFHDSCIAEKFPLLDKCSVCSYRF